MTKKRAASKTAPKRKSDAQAKPERGRGRPTEYDPAFVEQARKLCALGATDEGVADFFGISTRTLYRWKAVHAEFCQALKIGKDECDDRVERSLYHKAVGYTFEAVKIFNHQGKALVVPHKEHVPPDTTAAIFWLKNRRPELWRDVSRQEHTGKDGGPIETADVSPRDEFARRIAGVASRLGEGSSHSGINGSGS